MAKNSSFRVDFPHDPISWPHELRLLRGRGLTDGASILDLGCGPGYVTAALAREFPAARITALDHDAGILSLAKNLVAPKARVRILQGRAEALPLQDNSLDWVVARYVFQHLDDPQAAAREAQRVVRPGGRVAVIDIDAALWGLADPPFAATGGNPQRAHDRQIGRRLPRILQAAGFDDVTLEAFVYHSDDLGVAAFESQMTPQHYERFAAAPDPFVMMLGLVASGRKA